MTWRDLSTFAGLAFGVCRGFSFGVICSTTERITHVLKDQQRIVIAVPSLALIRQIQGDKRVEVPASTPGQTEYVKLTVQKFYQMSIT